MSATGIYGLSGSGIDVDSMVKVGMMSKQSEYDRMYKKEVKQEWTKQAYADLYSDLNTFNSTTMSKYKMSSTMNPQNVSSTNTAVATATANADAASMSHVVNVTKSASNAYLLTGNEGIKRATNNDGSIYLRDLIDTSQLSSNDDKLSFTVSDGNNSATITFTAQQLLGDNETLNDLVSAFNSTGLNIKASYDSNNDSFSLYNSTGGSANGIYLTAGTLKTETDENGESVETLDKSDALALQLLSNLNLHTVTTESTASGATSTLSDAAINLGKMPVSTESSGTASSAGDGGSGTVVTITGDYEATIRYGDNDTATVKIGDKTYTGTRTAFEDGNGVLVEYQDDDGNTVSVAIGNDNGVDVTTTTPGDYKTNVGMSGTDAEVTIDGRTYKSATNKITVSNVTYSLLSTGSSTLTVTQDTDKVVENVLKFVEDYNEMLGKLNDMYNEQKYSDYDVLTESQKKGMTQEQIEKWEEKAKSGLMYHNQTVGKLISAMREAIYTPVESVEPWKVDESTGKEYRYSTLMSIGIESRTDRGILRVDEDKLRAAIANDPDCVYQLFGSLDTENDEFSSNGVAQRIGDVANDALKEIKTYAGTSSESADGSSLGNLIEEMKKKMSDFKTMLNAFENSLYKKYDAMESAIQRMGVSLGYITGGQ